MSQNGESQRFRVVDRLVPIAGTWAIEPEMATFTGYDDPSFKVGIALGDVRASSGMVRAEVELNEVEEASAHFVFGYDSARAAGWSIGIGGFGHAYSLDRFAIGQGAVLVHGLGVKANLKPHEPYRIETIFRGSNVQLSVNSVKVFEHNLPHALAGDQVGIWAYGDDRVTFRDVQVATLRPRAFVVMQFTEPYNSLWEEVIKPVAGKVGFDAYRSDDVFGPGVVLQDIVRGISTSQAIIAEVTPSNANVYYELGYAHAVGTPTILLAEQPHEGRATLPFDISGFRCIFYDDAIRGKRKVEVALERHLRNILDRSDNGVVAD